MSFSSATIPLDDCFFEDELITAEFSLGSANIVEKVPDEVDVEDPDEHDDDDEGEVGTCVWVWVCV